MKSYSYILIKNLTTGRMEQFRSYADMKGTVECLSYIHYDEYAKHYFRISEKPKPYNFRLPIIGNVMNGYNGTANIWLCDEAGQMPGYGVWLKDCHKGIYVPPLNNGM